MTRSIHLLDALAEGRRAEKLVRATKAEGQLGELHTGASGIMHDGQLIGGCPRVQIARSAGIDKPMDATRYLMFDAGYANEDIIQAKLEGAGLMVRGEADNECGWTTAAGTVVHCHPDLVIVEERTDPMTLKTEVVPVLGIECKLASSLWTCKDVGFGDPTPKSDHLIQAASYMWQTGLPFDLLYTVRADFAIPPWANSPKHRMFAGFPDQVQLNDRNDPKKVIPFYSNFELDWSATGQLTWRHVGTGNSGTTVITVEAIEAYYNHIDKCRTEKSLGPRPTNLEVTGGEQGWDRCSPSFCPFSATCDRHEADYTRWLEEVRKVAAIS